MPASPAPPESTAPVPAADAEPDTSAVAAIGPLRHLRAMLVVPTACALLGALGLHLGFLMGLVDAGDLTATAEGAWHRAVAVALAGGGLLLGWLYVIGGRAARRIEADARRIAEMATRDPLTGLFDHRAFYTLLEQELHRAGRYGQPVAVLMVEVDRLREVNERHGHRAGDRVLAQVASAVLGTVRRIDAACRYGGTEMAVILPQTGLTAARRAAERIRERVAGAPFEVGGETAIRVTVSVGIAAHPPAPADTEALVRAADDAVYAAKAAGRDRVVEAPLAGATPV